MSFVRSAWSGLMVSGGHVPNMLGDTSADPQYWYGQLHALALSIVQAQQRAVTAKAAGDLDLARSEVENVARLRDSFVQVRGQFLATSEAQDPTATTATDRIILLTGQWVQGFMDALPGTLAAVPNAILDAAGQIGVKAGLTALGVSIPLVGLGLLALWLLTRAERSSVVRAAVRHV